MLPEAVSFPPLKPEQFHDAMTLPDVASLVGDRPRAGGRLAPGLMDDAEVFTFDQGLLVGLQGGRLAYVLTRPLPSAR